MEMTKAAASSAVEKQVYITVSRESRETRVQIELGLFPGPSTISSGLGFFDHLLNSLAHHAGWSLSLTCEGDLEIDDHHSAEDCAITLGVALKEAVASRGAIKRFGYAYAPLDESLARAVVDISGRPWCEAELSLERAMIGDLASENVAHFLSSFAFNAGITLHVDVLRGSNDHHKAEAAFKALALALREALTPALLPAETGPGSPNSTKGAALITISRRGKTARGTEA